MRLLKKLGPTGGAAVFAAFAAAIWAVLACLLLRMPPLTAARFLAFQLLCVAAPGLALHKLTGIRTTPLESLVFSYGWGLAAVIAVYFCLAPFGAAAYIPYALAALGAAALAVLFMRRKQHMSALPSDGALLPALLCCLAAAALTFILLSMANLNPALAGARTYYHDTMNGAGLTLAAARGFPMQTLQMAGWEFRYHTFFYSYTASVYLGVGAAAFETVMQLSLITVAPFCVAAFTALLARLSKSRAATALGAAAFTLIPACGYTHYLYMDTIGFSFGLAFSLLAVLAFLKAQEMSAGVNRLHIAASVFLVCAMGAKGPVAVSYLFGICFALLIELIAKKNWQVIPKGLLYAVPFLGLYFLIYGTGAAGDSMSVRPLIKALSSDFYAQLSGSVPQWLQTALAVLRYSFDAARIVPLCLLILFVAYLAARVKVPLASFCFGTAALGYVLINVFSQMGSSEVYFLTGVYPVLFACALAALAALLRQEKQGRRLLALLLAGALSACMLPDARSDAEIFIGKDGKTYHFPLGWQAAVTYSPTSDERLFTDAEIETCFRRGISVTPAEYEAYLWLRDNTPEDAVIASYRYSLNNKYFCGSCFSERAFYLEGWGYITMEDSNSSTPEKVARDAFLFYFYEYQEEPAARILYQQGCDYILIERVVSGNWELSDKYVEEVFRNKDVIIYRIIPWELT